MRTIFLVLAIAALGAVGVTTAIMSSVATPAHAAVKRGTCPNSSEEFCITGGSGQQNIGSGGRFTLNDQTGDFSLSGGGGHTGGEHITGNTISGERSCVGSGCR